MNAIKNKSYCFLVPCYFTYFVYQLPIILIIFSNDVNLNPGPGTHSQNNLFNFMSWNVSLAKDNFQRVRLIETHNSIFNYDLVSICETSLNDSVELPDTLLNDYTFVPANNPVNTRNGGVGLFYKNSLPVLVRNDLSLTYRLWLNEKIFFTVLYRTPSFNHTSPEFQDFLLNFENLYLKIKTENPSAIFFTGYFNAHSQLWWTEGDTTPEELFSKLGVTQFISEPTNFEPHNNPSG